jgi:hypothetical protein
MSLRKLALVLAVVLASSRSARADVGVGLFVGEPLGLDVKIGLGQRSGLDLLFGWDTYRDAHANYGHVTYLVTPFIGHGESVNVPLRLGIGVALFDDGGNFGNNINVAVRAPLEIGLRFHSAPVEIYGELAFKITFIDTGRNNPAGDLDGGIGFRIFF